MQPLAQNLVVVATERVAGNVGALRVVEQRNGILGTGGEVIHAYRYDANGAGDEFIRAASFCAVPFHIVHAAVEATGQPFCKTAFCFREVDACDAKRLEAEILGPALDIGFECCEVDLHAQGNPAGPTISIIVVMRDLPVEIYPVEVVREIDRCAIDGHGIAGYELMNRAARAAYDEARRSYPTAEHWLVLAGPGNNAGDAYVVARLAADNGIDVVVLALSDPALLSGDAGIARADYVDSGGRVETFTGVLPGPVDLIVDGLFGSGLVREVGGDYGTVIDLCNDHHVPVLALDIPSGIAGNSGSALGRAIRADVTVGFVGLKPGYFLGEGIDHTGRLVFAGIGVPRECYPVEQAVLERIPDYLAEQLLEPRQRNAHKGDFGHVLVVGGAPGMAGAALMAGMSALRAGAGRVTVATHPSHASQFMARCPELMVRGIECAADLAPLVDNASVIALGPGMGEDDWSKSVFASAAAVERPAVWDAGALTLLAAGISSHPERIVTPHPGEAGRLLGRTAGEVQSDRLAALDDLVDIVGGVVVLKGACTLVGQAGRTPRVSIRGNPGMATAGSGDILTGVVAGLRAQGLSIADAAMLGVDVHARAGDLAAEDGGRGLIATDLLPGIRRALNP